MNKIELYAIALIVMLAAGAGAYFKGRADGIDKMEQRQLAANAQVFENMVTAAQARADADTLARKTTEEFTARVRKGMADVDARFKGLPNVVLDARGCSVLSDSFRLHFDQIGAASIGRADSGAAGANGAVSSGATTPAR